MFGFQILTVPWFLFIFRKYFFSYFFFRKMSSTSITCSSYIDYSTRRNCPLYNVDRCPTPDTPILCPMIDNEPRSPCTRFICSTETQFSSEVVTSSTPRSSTTSNVVSTIVNGISEVGTTASLQLTDSQVIFSVNYRKFDK